MSLCFRDVIVTKFCFFYTFLLLDFHIVFTSLGIEFSLPLVEERRSNELEPQKNKGVEDKEKAGEWVSLLLLKLYCSY